MCRRSTTWYLVALLTVLATPVPGMAQDKPKADVAASYSLLYVNDLGDLGQGSWMSVGWLGAVAVHLNDWASVVGEFGANYKSITESGVDVSVDVLTYLGGVRFRGSANPKVVPFGQVLLGGAHVGAGADAEGVNVGASVNGFALQPGAGVDLFFGPRAGIRIQGDYRSVWAEGDSNSEFRFAVGVVFAFGGR